MIEMRRVHYCPYEGSDAESATMCRGCLDKLRDSELEGEPHKYGELLDDEREWLIDMEMPEDIYCEVCDVAMDADEDSDEED